MHSIGFCFGDKSGKAINKIFTVFIIPEDLPAFYSPYYYVM